MLTSSARSVRRLLAGILVLAAGSGATSSAHADVAVLAVVGRVTMALTGRDPWREDPRTVPTSPCAPMWARPELPKPPLHTMLVVLRF